ncbi:MAG TPA: hypothetical protein DEQ80_06445 [Anaerolinea thermolimosa]|uniref:Uncharacterized protein n=1 Tax=Anaerolinea thermolimosa TaxID=229919 RepID=A0A0M8JPV6_9CHLR|nr:hypothetical protein [Anaerolinea thermolimosa]GAP08807.1 hypothetical protein ATHL_03716 [Anaerolinea thermolimosa]GAP08857.1 hypothetical protein ATHL_03767 [Anaerolinea thermolimosa]HCE17481.1 hypothetical protein [Anaerolinea thermolimosa]
MSWLADLLNKPYSSHHKVEVEKLLDELVSIGLRDDYLSERPGSGFNMQCRNIRARQIGTRLNEIGGLAMMEYAQRYVRRKAGKLGRTLAEHLEYAWVEIGDWMK